MKSYFFIIPFLLFSLIPTHILVAQVTIGLSEAPEQGALIQLKNIQGVTGNKANATKGIMNARVKLLDRDKLYPMYSYKDDNSTPSLSDKKTHIGLVVWNVTENEVICPGIHVWEGDIWDNLNLSLNYITDTRTLPSGDKEVITYPIGTFGEAGTWMLTNLRASVYADGATVAGGAMILKANHPITDYTGKYYYYPPAAQILNLVNDRNNLLANPQLGLLYTWAAATGGNKNSLFINEGEGFSPVNMSAPSKGANPNPTRVEQVGIQGICPNGWHLPSDKEMNDLEKYISEDQEGETYDKETVPTYTPTIWNEDWRITQGGLGTNRGTHAIAMASAYDGLNPIGRSKKLCTGSGGFSAYQVGYVYNGGGSNIGQFGDYWTSSKGTQDIGAPTAATRYRVWYRGIGTDYDSALHRRAEISSIMMSVRCKRNN